MSPVGAILVPFPLKTGTNLLHPLPSRSLNWSDFVSMTLGQKEACWLFIHPKLLKYETYRIEVLKCFSSVRQNQRVGWSKVVLVVVEVLPVGSKPPVAVGERISKGETHDLGAPGHPPLNKGVPEVRFSHHRSW